MTLIPFNTSQNIRNNPQQPNLGATIDRLHSTRHCTHAARNLYGTMSGGMNCGGKEDVTEHAHSAYSYAKHIVIQQSLSVVQCILLFRNWFKDI